MLKNLRAIAADPATPSWARELVEGLAGRDIVDVANTLEVLACAATADCEEAFMGVPPGPR